jgi:uncharacterized lipoprotein YehR (DUF1307 family)
MPEEKIMKKILVVLVLLFALTSCGGSTDLSSVLSRISKNQATDTKLFEKAINSITVAYTSASFEDALLQLETSVYACDYDAIELAKINEEYAEATKYEEARTLVDQGVQILLAVNKARRAWLVDVQKAIAKDDADIVREAVARNDANIKPWPDQIAQAHAYFSQAKEIEGLPHELTEFQ